MAAAVDTTNFVQVYTATTTTPQTLSVTCAAGDTILVVFVSLWASADPTSVTWGAANLTKLSNQSYFSTNYSGSVWYLLNPVAGTNTLSVNRSGLNGSNWIAALPLSGVNPTSAATAFGTPSWTINNTSPVTAIATTATGGGANDIYIGFGYLNLLSTQINDASGNMTRLGNAGDNNNAYSTDYVLGSNPGLMSYSSAAGGPRNTGAALSLPVLGATSAALAGVAGGIASAGGALATIAAPFAPILLDDPAHRGASDSVYMGTGVPNTGDLAPVAFTKLKQWAIDVNTMVKQIYPQRSLQAPSTGFSIAVAQGITQLRLNPAGTLATGTITLPQNPGDQQPFRVLTSQTITSLTVNTADGTTLNAAPTTLAANTSIKWIFEADLNTWFRQQ